MKPRGGNGFDAGVLLFRTGLLRFSSQGMLVLVETSHGFTRPTRRVSGVRMKLQFSGHAMQRMFTRGISPEDV